jgi:pyrophosphate--fructose-6-phosphate 1-phosphotransferase
VVVGLYEALKRLHPDSSLVGFLEGPEGVILGKGKELDAATLEIYRNQGGFDLLGSGRFKIETQEQMELARLSLEKFRVEGLVIVGGDDSNTNAAVLAEYFMDKKSRINVIGVPKTIDGDLRNSYVEIPFGFDTACKVYAECIGNIGSDALSARKYYHFIRLMGRSASHVALECALVTHPNLTFIGEEVAQLKRSLKQIVKEIADLITTRAQEKKHFGVIVIPEGLIEFIPEVRVLIQELNVDSKALSAPSAQVFSSLPAKIQQQLLLDRDPHGNVRVSSIETEFLLLELVKQELSPKIPFSAVNHFFGYEGRAAFPSNFDCQYCTALGFTAALLLSAQKTGMMAAVSNLSAPPREWQLGGVPLVALMQFETRKGKQKPVIAKALVDLQGKAFTSFKEQRAAWELQDLYCNPGPLQFFGSAELTDPLPFL